MICHIVKNGGYMFLILYIWLLVADSSISKNTYTIQEFCYENLYIYTVEPGEPYQLTLRSDASSEYKWYRKSKRKCQKEFKTTDPSAHFVVLISNMTIPSCSGCRCNYFEISASEHKKRYCGRNETEYFSSKTDKISVDFYHGTSLPFDVTFTFNVKRNVFIITGSATENSYGPGSFVETPYFPIPYSPNYRAEYILQSDVNSHVLLLFLDFQISDQSFIEVVGSNSTYPTRFYGNIFRPPVIFSQSNSLSLKFESSNQPGMPGFRALCSFIKSIDPHVIPYTDCGGQKDGRGGYMTVKILEGVDLYDCIWHVTPAVPPVTKSYLSVSVQLKNIGSKSYLEFRNGPNSKSALLKNINCETDDCSDLNIETSGSASSGLYIRFSGYLDTSSNISMTYSTFHLGNCSDKEFMCEDGRCLLSDFRCDGVKQCPNGTDEENCLTTSNSPVQVVPYRPGMKTENILGSDALFKKFLIVVVFGSFGILTVVSVTVIILMCRYDKGTPEIVEGEPQQVLGEMHGMQPSLYSVDRFDNDNLPSYEDFIKATDTYPPLLYTRSKKNFFTKGNCIQSTSFNQDSRVRLHSINSFNFRGSDSDTNIFSDNGEIPSPQPECSNFCNVEVHSCPVRMAFKNMKRSYSLDSKLNDFVKHDTCLFLSIMHPCNHISSHCKKIQFHTLPANFKTGTTKEHPKINPGAWLIPDSNGNYPKSRGFTWSYTPHTSANSDVCTVKKSRCCSDPCRRISVHYSVY